jgi:TPR repeat protein
MRTCNWWVGAYLAGAALSFPAYAFDGAPGSSIPQSVAAAASAAATSDVVAELTPRRAYENGLKSYFSGDKATALSALQYAAGKGHPIAQWKLGRMYAEGDGVVHDDLKAFDYFSQIVRLHASEDPEAIETRARAPYLADAIVQLGYYYLEGIPGTYVKPNLPLARDLFTNAAFNYGDPNAQYKLALMYLEGTGVKKDSARAVRLLNLAVEKDHPSSRALLGHILFAGEAVKKNRPLGLMWMTLAREPAELGGNPADKWIVDFHEAAVAAASEDERAQARDYLERYLQARN